MLVVVVVMFHLLFDYDTHDALIRSMLRMHVCVSFSLIGIICA
jgi:hypothetical protein